MSNPFYIFNCSLALKTYNQKQQSFRKQPNIKMAELATEVIRSFLDDERSAKVVDLGYGTGLVGL